MVFLSVAASLTISAQSKEITSKEYTTAKNAAETAMWNSVPRIETYTYKSDEPRDIWFRKVVETNDRTYEESKRITSSGTEFEEEVRYDSERFIRVNNGLWTKPKPPAFGIGMGSAGSVTVYTVETITKDGKTFTLYTETSTFKDGKKYISWIKVDDKGRVAEYQDNEDFVRHMIYEYIDKITPIKKPRLGTKDDVRPKP